jgi:hypothetical protein
MPAVEVPHSAWDLILAVNEKETTAASAKVDGVKHIAQQLQSYYEMCGHNVTEELEKARPRVLEKKESLELADIRKEERQISLLKLARSAARLRKRLNLYTEAEDNLSKTELGNDWHEKRESLRRKKIEGEELDMQLEELQALRRKLKD